MADLFVSYKSEDRTRVAPLVAALEADGISVWWDAHIGSGSSWRESIETNLHSAKCVLVVWSERSIGAEGSFVRDEATRSLRRGAYLPVRIDNVEPPLGFGETQAASLIGWKGDRTDPRYQEVLASVRAVIAGTPRPIPAAYTPKRTLDRRLVIGGGVAAVAVAGAGGWWATHRPAAPGDSIAVLPFENLSGDPAQAYFSDGIAEELRSALARIASLKVAARTSSELMRDAEATTAAAKLGVATILSGTVRRGGGTIRINAELIDGLTGLTRWSEAYDRAIGDALAIQSGIAESVAGALSIALGKAQKALLTAGGTTNPVAQDAYLRGTAAGAKQQVEESSKEFGAAVAADPGFALARAGLAQTIAMSTNETASVVEINAKLDRAEAEARRAVALAPGLGWPLAVLGIVLFYKFDFRGANAAYASAYTATPGDASVLRAKSAFDGLMGRADQSIAVARRASSLDPLRPNGPNFLGGALLRAGRIDEAIPQYRATLARIPGNSSAVSGLCKCLILKGKTNEAMETAKQIPEGNYFRFFVEAIATAATDRAASDRSLAEIKKVESAWYQSAAVHAWRRENDLAFAALTRAWANRDGGLADLKTDQFLAPIRSDPRYGEWVRRIGFV